MGKIRVIVALDPSLLGELLSDHIQREQDMEVVGRVFDPVDLLLKVGETQADVVIHSWPDGGQMPGICSTLLAEYPELLVIGMDMDGGTVTCRQTIATEEIPAGQLQDLLDRIRGALVAS